MENPILKIDFTTLRGQKRTLLDVIDKLEKGCKDQLEIDDLTGILHLIDAIQDYAVDELGVNEMHVYDFELEEEREKETPQEKFARESAERIFDELCESDGFHTDDEMPEKFIESVMADRYDSDIIKAKIRAQILNDLKVHPVLFDITETTKELQYDGDMREDYEGIATTYIREKFNSGKTKCVHLCMSCGSDNVQVKAWVKPNQNNSMVDEVEGDELGYCDDCQQNVNVDTASLKVSAKVVGYQVVGEDGSEQDGEIHHQMDGSFCLYSLEQARSMMDDNDNGKERWRLLTIWEGDVEEPTMMFEGDPRNPTENYPSTNTIG